MEKITKYLRLFFLIGGIWFLTPLCVAQESDTISVIDSGANPANWSRFTRDTLMNDTLIREMLKGVDDIALEWDSTSVPAQFEDPVSRVRQQNNWRYVVLLFILLVIGFSRLIAPGIIGKYFQAFLKPKLLNDLLDDQQSEISGFSLLVTFIVSLTYALPLQLILEFTGNSMTDYPWGDFALLSVFIFAYFIFKLFLEALGGRIFEAKFFTTALLYCSVFVNFFSALILIPAYLYVLLNDLNVDAKIFWIAIIAGAGLLLLTKVLRALVQSAGTFSYPAFYLILYLCALEIAPWLLLYKLLEINLI